MLPSTKRLIDLLHLTPVQEEAVKLAIGTEKLSSRIEVYDLMEKKIDQMLGKRGLDPNRLDGFGGAKGVEI